MKRAFLAMGLLALLAVPVGAGSVGIHGGWVDTDEAEDDIGAGLRFGFGVSPAVDIQLRGTDFRELMARAEGEDVPFQATMVDLGFAYKFVKSGRLTPYVGAGGTYYVLSTNKSSQGRLEDEYGWYGLVGLDLPVGPRWVVYAEGMWRDAKATLKGDDLGFGSTVDQSINLNGPQVNLGIAFGW